MGIVYKARQIKCERIVALKMVLGGGHANEADLTRFRIEAEAVSRLQHPTIIKIHEIGEHHGLPYLALEYCGGGSLTDLLTGTPLTHERAAQLMQALAGAVQAAHKQGIVHRDLKPGNILMTEDGQPRLTDFGLAKLLDAKSVYTQTGAVLGTPSYMAPEQAAGRTHDIGPATDVYGLGTILYEMLTGRPPFRAATLVETMEQVKSQEPAAPRLLQPRTPRDLETICLKCLQKEPGKRYASGAELAEDLARFLAGRPVKARPVGARERLGRWCRRNPVVAGLLAAVAGLLLLVAGGAVFAALTYKESASREHAQYQRMIALEIQTLLLQGNYDEALSRVMRHQEDLGQESKELTGQIRAAWQEAVRKELRDKNFAGALATAGALLTRFSSDPDASGLRREAFQGVLAIQVRTLLQHQDHAHALMVVRSKRAELPDQGRELEKLVRDDWLHKAQRQLGEKHFQQASDTTRGFLAEFGRDFEAQSLSSKATYELLKLQIQRLIGEGHLAEAAAAVENHRADLPEDGAALKMHVRSAWLARAETAATQHRIDEAVKACDDLLVSFKDDPEASNQRKIYAAKLALMQNEKARALLAGARDLEGAAHRLRRVSNPGRPFSPADANEAYRELKEASALWSQAQQPLPLSLRVDLALAAFYKPAPDLGLFQELAAATLGGPDAKKLGNDAYALLLARAKAQEQSPPGWRSALAAYQDLLARAWSRPADAEAASVAYAALQTAAADLDKADKADSETVKLRARYYAALGRLLRDPAGSKLTAGDANRRAYEWFTQAAALDPANADYLIGKAVSRTALPDPNWKELESAGRRAVELAPLKPASYNLLGYALLMQARRETGLDGRIRGYTHAFQTFRDGVDHADQDDEELPQLLLNRSMTALELGTYLAPTDRSSARKYLEDARKNAERATRLGHANPEYVHETLGYVLENMAFLLGETDRYPEAVVEFDKAIQLKPERAAARIARARCHYRLAAAGKGDRSILQEALSDLRAATERNPTQYQRADALYLEGLVYELLGNDKAAHAGLAKAADAGEKSAVLNLALEADADLYLREAAGQVGKDNADAALASVQAAAQIAERIKSSDAPKSAAVLGRVYQAKAGILLAQAENLLAQSAADERGRQFLAQARRLADALEGQSQLVEAAIIRGQALAIAGNAQEAFQAFSRPLPDDPSRLTFAHASLLVARTSFCLSNRCPPALRPAAESLIADVDRAARLAPTVKVKGDALALAGAARGAAALAFVDQPAKQQQYREEAADNLRKAIAAAPNHPENWAFHWRLAKELHSLTVSTPQAGQRETYRAEAIRELSLALEHAPARYREELVRFQAVLDDGKNAN
jgi:tetratricopeptide (TPR) repeat protein/tRNA A-37 threonylcarbamoyl transferase component Bud32